MFVQAWQLVNRATDPVAGSLSRTALAYQSGSKTQMTSFFTALLIGATLLFLTSLLYHTPNCVLAAIVISAATVLIDVNEPLFLWRIGERIDLIQYLLVLIFTLCLGPGLQFVFRALYTHPPPRTRCRSSIGCVFASGTFPPEPPTRAETLRSIRLYTDLQDPTSLFLEDFQGPESMRTRLGSQM